MKRPFPVLTASTPAEFVVLIQALRDTARDAGIGTMEHLLTLALLQAEQRIRDDADRNADPDELWRPV